MTAISSTTSRAGFWNSTAASGIPHEGNYSSFLVRAGKAPAAGRRAGRSAQQRAIAREREWISQSPARAPGQIEGAHHTPMRNCWRNRRSSAAARRRSSFRWPSGWARWWSKPKDLEQGLWRPAAVREPEFQPAAGRHCRRDRPQRRRQDDAVPHSDRAGKARCRRACASATRCRWAMSISRAMRSMPNKTVWEEISGGLDVLELGKRTMPVARLCRRLQFQGRRPAEEGRPAIGRRAQPRASGQDAEIGRQSAAARRTDQRSRRRNLARAGNWRSRISPAAP